MTQTNTVTETQTNTATVTNSQTRTSTATNTSTNTPTVQNTATNTITASPTNTVTNTQTSTDTLADTATNTNTPSYTPTMTETNTSTPTLVNTATSTNSVTNTQTETSTPTDTNTNTPLADTATNTDTPTVTNTNTVTNTQTQTNTFTPPANTYTSTSTQTVTNTQTSTNTQTNTNTGTPTLVNTATSTASWTVTNTSTSTMQNTYTATSTHTATGTATVTMTQTSTNTPVSGVTMAKVASETQAQAGDTITYGITITISGNTVSNPVVTDVLPTGISFYSVGNYPAGTVFNQSGSNLTWTLPASLGPGTYTLTYTGKVSNFSQADVPLTNHAQLNYSGGSTLNAYAPVTVIGNFSIGINIYNSAGEVIRTIPIQHFSTAITNITLSTTNTITTLQGPGSSINIIFDGVVIGTWDGNNNQGVPVANGSYRVQIDNIASSGTVTSVSQNAIVNRSIAQVEVDIFNQAGEVVRRLYNVLSNPVGSSMTNVTLSAGVIKPSVSAPVSTGPNNTQSQIRITILDSSTPVTLTWDGTNDQDSFVTPGEYQVQVHWTDGSGNTTDITKSVLVLPSSGPAGKVIAYPNEIKGAVTFSTFDASAVTGAATMKIRIYTVSGELVQAIPTSSMTYNWYPQGLASGLYIASVEVDNANGGLLTRQNLKILILH